jgi:hypothetical protein
LSPPALPLFSSPAIDHSSENLTNWSAVAAAIFAATSSSRPLTDVSYCVHALAKRLSKTRNWVVRTPLPAIASSPIDLMHKENGKMLYEKKLGRLL